MLLYGLASDLSNDAELFVRLEDAKRELGDALHDEPGWAGMVYVVRIAFGEPSSRE